MIVLNVIVVIVAVILFVTVIRFMSGVVIGHTVH
jgi:hypothetical protein